METIVEDGELSILMTGQERYPIIGEPFYAFKADSVFPMFKGLPLYAGCFEKAVFACEIFGGSIAIGAMRVLSEDGKSAYGFNFNPPRELHCWVQSGQKIFDLSLPGVIMRGMKLCDEFGPFLTGRTPSVLCGPPPNWLLYNPVKMFPLTRTGLDYLYKYNNEGIGEDA